MTYINRLLIIISIALFNTAFADSLNLPNSTKTQLESAFNTDGKVMLIVGLSDLITAKTLSSASIKSAKTRFLRSTSVVKSLVRQSLHVIDELEHLPFVVMQVNRKGLKTLQAHPQVISIEADYPHEPYLKDAVPHVIGINNPWSKSYYNGAGTSVAILDTGVDTRHPMFAGKTILQACFTSDRSCPNNANTQYNGNAADPIPNRKGNHGTHVAGIAVGNYIPAKNFGGVAHQADLIAVQVFNKDKSAYNSSLLRGLNYIYAVSATRNIAAVNLSLGRGWNDRSTCDSYSPSITSIVSKLRDNNIAVVAPVGNHRGSGGNYFPTCISDVISVSGAEFYGGPEGPYSTWSYGEAPKVSLIAPAKNIESAVIGNNYVSRNGTSLAAALVSGVFAVMRKIRPDASVSSLETALQITGDATSYIDLDVFDCFEVECGWYYNTEPFPVVKKTISQIGGSKKQTTAIGFNNAESINKLQTHANDPLKYRDGIALDVNGVGVVRSSYLDGLHSSWVSHFLVPKTILTGRIAAKLRYDNSLDNPFGIVAKVGGGIDLYAGGEMHDGYKLSIKNSGQYSVYKYEHGNETAIIPWTTNPSIVKMNDWNILMATMGGKSIKFYVNGNFIGQHTSDRLVYGSAGIHYTLSPDSYGGYVDWIVAKNNSVNPGYR